MAPLVVHGRVPIGNSGGEYGVRGWLIALDAQNGKELWPRVRHGTRPRRPLPPPRGPAQANLG